MIRYLNVYASEDGDFLLFFGEIEGFLGQDFGQVEFYVSVDQMLDALLGVWVFQEFGVLLDLKDL